MIGPPLLEARYPKSIAELNVTSGTYLFVFPVGMNRGGQHVAFPVDAAVASAFGDVDPAKAARLAARIAACIDDTLHGALEDAERERDRAASAVARLPWPGGR